MTSELSKHVDEFHGALEAGEGAVLIQEHKDMLGDISELKHNSTLIVELVAGKPVLDKFTNLPTGEREPGIAVRVEALEHSANGGGGFSIKAKDKAQLIGFMTIVIIALERASKFL